MKLENRVKALEVLVSELTDWQAHSVECIRQLQSPSPKMEVVRDGNGWKARLNIPAAPWFYSRYRLWAQAHVYRWFADELYKLKTLTTEVDS